MEGEEGMEGREGMRDEEDTLSSCPQIRDCSCSSIPTAAREYLDWEALGGEEARVEMREKGAEEVSEESEETEVPRNPTRKEIFPLERKEMMAAMVQMVRCQSRQSECDVFLMKNFRSIR